MYTRKVTDYFPSLVGTTATLFRYDRWDKLLLLQINFEKKERMFLACHNCEYIEFDGYIQTDRMTVVENTATLILKEQSRNFLLKCASIELWNYDKFDSYDLELSLTLDDKRYGVTKPILSIEELQ